MGGIAIGIASDEVRRYGINQIKRSRLIKAGADIIIRDYSSYNKLIDLLFIKKSIKPDDLIPQIDWIKYLNLYLLKFYFEGR